MERQLVVFEIAKEYFGVNIDSVEGIIKLQPITKVPHAPDFIEGVTNLRGSVLPVVDLRKRFGLPKQDSSHNRIVTVAIQGLKVGMIVDSVSEVLRVPEDAIEPPPSMVTTIDSAFITGIAKINDRLVILLDLARVLSIEEQSTLQSVSAVP